MFRQAVALYTRKDHGPNRGLAGQGRVALLWAALRFARGEGAVPRMHKWLPETTFAEVEKPRGPWPMEVEAILERYYTLKVGALQFCGPASFGLPFWEGLESLALTFPVIAWVSRLFTEGARASAFLKALSIVDDHFGFNRQSAALLPYVKEVKSLKPLDPSTKPLVVSAKPEINEKWQLILNRTIEIDS